MPTTRYTPDTFEQECICLLYTWLAENGFQNPDLPPIYLSFETPTRIENIWRVNSKDEEGRDDSKWFTTVGGIGLYRSKRCSDSGTPEIVLYAQGITAVAKRLNVPTEMLRAVVLIHEIGHWISHAVKDSNYQTWKTDDFDLYLYKNPSPLLEMWAQLFPYWVAKEIQGLFKLTFEALNSKQSDPYKTFQQFTHHKKEDMLKVLIAFHRDNRNEENETKKTEDFNTGYYEKLYKEEALKAKLIPGMNKVQKNSGIF